MYKNCGDSFSASKDTRRGDKFQRVAKHFSKTGTINSAILPRPPRKSTGNGRKINQAVAEETLEILANGFYDFEGEKVLLPPITEGQTYTPEKLINILDSLSVAPQYETQYRVIKSSIIGAIFEFYREADKWTVLSFASAKHPGGGFLRGSQAQEESLARATGLYATIKDSPMYAANEKDNVNCLYQEYMIYSENVPVFRDENDDLISSPVYIDIISVPAVNAGEALKKGVSNELIDETRYKRLDSLFALMVTKGVKRVVLGAWGCGVFGGNFEDLVEDYYLHLIVGKYRGAFEEVIFSLMEDNDCALLSHKLGLKS
jgi:uncharacterized protein (TIGR02452 family)